MLKLTQTRFFKIMNTTRINIINIVGSPNCIESSDGQKIFNIIIKSFEEQISVELSFLNVRILTTAFLNTAVGHLYKDYNEEFIKSHLKVTDITQSGLISLKRVVDTAKLYYKDPEAMERSVREILGEA